MSEPLADRSTILFRSLRERTDELQQLLELGLNKKIDALTCQPPASWSILEIPEILNSRGLTFVLFASEGGYLAFLPETPGLLPRNYGAMASDPGSSFAQMASRLQELLLSNESGVPAAQVGKCKVFSSVARRAGIDSASEIIPLNFSWDGRSGCLWFVGKASAPEQAFSKNESERNRRAKTGFANSLLSGLTSLSKLSRNNPDIRFEEVASGSGAKIMRRDDEHSEIAVQERIAEESTISDGRSDVTTEDNPSALTVRGTHKLADASVLRAIKKNLPQISQSVLPRKSINGKMEKVNRNSNSLLTQGDKNETEEITGKDQLRQEKEEQVVQAVQESYGQAVQERQSAQTGEGRQEAQKSQIISIENRLSPSTDTLASPLSQPGISDSTINITVESYKSNVSSKLEESNKLFDDTNTDTAATAGPEIELSDPKSLESMDNCGFADNPGFISPSAVENTAVENTIEEESQIQESEEQKSDDSLDSFAVFSTHPLEEVNSLIQTLQAVSGSETNLEPEILETNLIETEPIETEPVETEPIETEPVETEPIESEPIESEPIESEPIETEPIETEPIETEPIESEPIETEPIETEPIETEPIETEPIETEPIETEPIETEPIETETIETETIETEPIETEPIETKPIETEPIETEPIETEPIETEPIETEPIETEPIETEPIETEPIETEPIETEPIETEPIETEPIETEPIESEPIESEPVETEPVETEPIETEPIETEPIETEPIETEPIETEPVETEPIETEPVETEPIESEPIESEPIETEPIETEPIETEPIESEPIETEPIETEPIETEPVETEPIETEPIETEPIETEPIETEPITDDRVQLNHPILGLKVRAEAIVANQRFFLGDILNWRPGQVLEFDDLTGQVELTVGHCPMATGWAVETDGRLGVLVKTR